MYNKDLLAIHDALEYWGCYIYRKLKMTIYTDYAALQYIQRSKKLSSHQWRYLDLLQQYDYEIIILS
jgi:hypothetical protein